MEEETYFIREVVAPISTRRLTIKFINTSNDFNKVSLTNYRNKIQTKTRNKLPNQHITCSSMATEIHDSLL